MPFVRRRPLLRAAVVGGGAYMAGKHMANAQADQQYQAQQAQQAQQQIDALQRQLDDLKQPVAGAHSAQRTVQHAGQPTQQAG